MKNLNYCLLFLLSLGLNSPLYAQTTLFSESFESAAFPPTGWSHQNTGSGNPWTLNTSTLNSSQGSQSVQCRGRADAWLFTPAITVQAGDLIQIVFKEKISNDTPKLRLTVGNAQTVASQTITILDLPNLANIVRFATQRVTYKFPVSGTYYLGFNCYASTSTQYLWLDEVSVAKYPPCSGTPSAGIPRTTAIEPCVGGELSLTMLNATKASNISYQWQYSADSSSWANIVGASDTIYKVTTFSNATTYYRMAVNCENSGVTTNGTTITVRNTPTYTIDNTQPTAGTNFTSFTDAINWLNNFSNCTGLANSITFNVGAGQIFTENTPYIAATGTASAPITFRKSGIGANPIVKPTGRPFDLVYNNVTFGIGILGGDYFTFDGIDIQTVGSVSNYVLCGYSITNKKNLSNASRNGASNNTIKNCTITMGDYKGLPTFGIYQQSGYSNSYAASQSGANSNNRYLDIKIRNAARGFYLESNGFRDQNTEIGTATPNAIPATFSEVTGDSALNKEGYGVFSNYQENLKIHHLLVHDLSFTRNTTNISNNLIGIVVINSSGKTEIYNNKIYNLRGLANMIGMTIHTDIVAGAMTATTSEIYNNCISGLTIDSASGRKLVGLEVYTDTLEKNIYIHNNNIWVDASNARLATSKALGIGDYGGRYGGNYTIANNIFANTSANQTDVNAKHFCVKLTTNATDLAKIKSNNNIFYLPNSLNGFIGAAGTNLGAPTLENWRSTTGLDAASIHTNPVFTNPTDLHISNPDINNSAVASPAWVSLDMDNQARIAPHAYGADQFIPLTLDVAAFGIVTPNSTVCTVNNQILTVSIKNLAITTLNLAINPVVIKATVTGGGATTVLTKLLNSGTLASGIVQNVTFDTPVNMIAGGIFNFTISTTMAGDMNVSNDTTRNVYILTPSMPLPFSENFSASLNIPANWQVTPFWSVIRNRVNSSSCLSGVFNRSVPTTQITLPKIGAIDTTTELSFDYRVLDALYAPDTTVVASPAGWGSIDIQVSTDCGITFNTFKIITDSSHVVSKAWATKSYPLSIFAGKTIIIRLVTHWQQGDYLIDLDNFNITPPCSAAPIAGIMTISDTLVCPFTTVKLSTIGSKGSTSIQYQWQKSLDNGHLWFNMSNATTTECSISATTSTLYRMSAICINSGATSYTNTRALVVKTPIYAALPYAEDFENWSTLICGSTTPATNCLITPVNFSNTWRPDNFTGIFGKPYYTPVAESGARSARFMSSGTSSKGQLDLYLNFGSVETADLSFYYVNNNPLNLPIYDSLRVLLSIDGGETFKQTGLTLKETTPNWVQRNFTLIGAGSSTAIVRLEAVGYYIAGDLATKYDIGIDNLKVTPITELPNCHNLGFRPNPRLIDPIGPITLIWGTKTGAIAYDIYADLPNFPSPLVTTAATSYVYSSLNSLPLNTDYTVRIVPKNALGEVTNCDTIRLKTKSSLPYCQPTPRIIYGYQQLLSRLELGTLINQNVLNPGLSYTSASYTFFDTLPILDLVQETSQKLKLTYNNPEVKIHGRFAAAWIDYNQNGQFETAEFLGGNTVSASNGYDTLNFTIPPTAKIGKTRLRVFTDFYAIPPSQACYGAYPDGSHGQAQDYLVNIVGSRTCASGTPNITLANQTTICGGTTVSFSLQNAYLTTGITFQWQSSSLDGQTWSNITGAINETLNQAVSTTAKYRCAVICSGGTPTYATPVQITVKDPRLCYCRPPSICGTGYIDAVKIDSTTLNTEGSGCANIDVIPSSYSSTNAASTTPTLGKGGTYRLSVTTGASQSLSAWIDYNQDGRFDANEWTQITSASTPYTPSTVSIPIPQTAKTGMTFMRIRSRNAGAINQATDACTDFFSGETEDYALNILTTLVGSPASCSPVSTVNSSNSGMWLHLTDANGTVFTSILDDQNLGKITASYMVNNTGTVRTGSGRQYLDRNFGINSDTLPASNVTLRLYFTNAELLAMTDGTSLLNALVTRYPTEVCNGSLPNSRQVLATVTGRGTATSGSSYLQVSVPGFSAFYIHGGTTVLPVKVKTVNDASPLKVISVAPVPTTQDVTVNLEVIKTTKITLTLTNLLGQIIKATYIEAFEGLNSASLDLTSLAAGVYILQVSDGQNKIVRRVVKQ